MFGPSWGDVDALAAEHARAKGRLAALCGDAEVIGERKNP